MLALNHKKTTSSLAPFIFYVAKNWELKDRSLPIELIEAKKFKTNLVPLRIEMDCLLIAELILNFKTLQNNIKKPFYLDILSFYNFTIDVRN